jgi:hypothetical protein
LSLTLASIVLVGLFILNGIKLTKIFDAVTKSMVNISYTAVMWVVGLIITILGPRNEEFSLESLSWQVNVIKLAGFVVVVIGNLIYNNIILKAYLSKK